MSTLRPRSATIHTHSHHFHYPFTALSHLPVKALSLVKYRKTTSVHSFSEKEGTPLYFFPVSLRLCGQMIKG
jgi:hypothetical protein